MDTMFRPQKLIKARERKKLSRTDFMFALEGFGLRVSQPTLYRWESGKAIPDANQVAKLADFFSLPVQHFFN